jgi:hypothetical protein
VKKLRFVAAGARLSRPRHARDQTVNFFGHAIVACWFEPNPNFVFGAMLPDLASMLRLRTPRATDERVERGIALHHATDAAFHRASAFLSLARDARDALLACGLGLGSARALAHIGTEILLDEYLGVDPLLEAVYLDALGAAAEAAIEWNGERERVAVLELASTLRARGVPRSHPPEFVARRLRRALENHPRLAMNQEHEPAVAAWVSDARPRIETLASTLLDQVRVNLGQPAALSG